MRRVVHQVSWFIVVGCAASLTHWVVAVGLVSLAGVTPLLANLVGWLIAFLVSFSGHYRLTFRHQQARLVPAAARFFMVSALGFCINEASYAWLLRTTTIRYDVLLLLILVAIAVLTFALSRLWAFRSAPS